MPPRTANRRTAPQSASGNGKSDFVRPKTAQQAVAEALRRDITSGKLAPGSWIVQESLAEHFGMSRIPIREALKTLEAEEYITYVPHSGYRVAKLGLEELLEVFRLRDILEAELIRDAMPEVTDEVIERMRDQMAEMDRAAAAGDLIGVGLANREFHFLTFEASRMARTKRIVNQLWNTADAYRPLYAHLMDLDKVNSEHVLLVEAMAARDVERVVALNHEHRMHAIDHLHIVFGREDAEADS
ncbi:GntR family transcriptional regulator [Mycolicibacterium wolinskyi]|uniref:GntR family transcriptional regulator n=1 Tax=Mycolicibacterium wolinskyi TaxID=59750 RepID=A0A1X2F922_9MYCO|nr:MULTISPECIES: GntR family transcriptional regulator [Mycolicibacterium]MCV7286343.1 GntR family transcriptional regulator [Mycolicibacterium wolinskyi]MCV7293323.1 GntR family transcriptional regulator [Mycolicibacterium goodii]ORX14915.1 GntR family transcriptional regulator [Mycolicibacterium wolinskyi]